MKFFRTRDFFPFLDNKESDAEIKIYPFFIEIYASGKKKVWLDFLIKDFKHVLMENYEFQNLDAVTDSIFGHFGVSRTWKQDRNYKHNKISIGLATEAS